MMMTDLIIMVIFGVAGAANVLALGLVIYGMIKGEV